MEKRSITPKRMIFGREFEWTNHTTDRHETCASYVFPIGIFHFHYPSSSKQNNLKNDCIYNLQLGITCKLCLRCIRCICWGEGANAHLFSS